MAIFEESDRFLEAEEQEQQVNLVGAHEGLLQAASSDSKSLRNGEMLCVFLDMPETF